MHVTEIVPGLLSGDTTREESRSAIEHMRRCADCQDELFTALLAHAALSSANRFAPDIVRIEPRLRAGKTAAPAPSLPDLAAVFAEVRSEQIDERRTDPRRGHRRRVVIAAAAVLVTGAGTATALRIADAPSHPTPANVALSAFGVGTNSAQATIDDGVVRVDAASLPRLDRRHFYELWLTDTSRTHMQSLGSLDDDGQASVTVSLKLLGQYRDLEVSVQPLDQPAYSGTSVLRGSYA